ncbi:MAG TPA: hypothetical protein VKZ60_13545 [Chloroflexota bacterium]|nr:hypothetical protein [Chloroflexota bacterium]
MREDAAAVERLLARWQARVQAGGQLSPAECLWLIETARDLWQVLAALQGAAPPAPAPSGLAIGQRVRVRLAEPDLELASDRGTIIGCDELGYYRVWLDAPARYRSARGWQHVPVLCVSVDQLTALAARPSERAATPSG